MDSRPGRHGHYPHRELFIDGSWEPAESGATFPVTDPATGSVIAQVADAAPGDARRALDAAVAAGHGWARMPARERAEVLFRAHERVRSNRDWFARLVSLESGKPIGDSEMEIEQAANALRWFSEEAVRVTGRFGAAPNGQGDILISRSPVGPSYLITLWNSPVATAARKLAPALAAGCAVVLKPSKEAPLSTLALTATLAEVGLPAGVVNTITTTRAPDVAADLIADPRLRKLSFTGTTAVGRGLLARAGETVLRVSMELGGNAPFIVFDDADLSAAVLGARVAKFRNSGQAGTAANRFLMHEGIAGEFTRRIVGLAASLHVGRGVEKGHQIGALINAAAVDRIEALVADAVDRGARVVYRGDLPALPGSFYPPTVLTDVPAEARIQREAIFGPVVALSSFTDEDDAVQRANATEGGLAAYVYTRDFARGQRMIERLEVGTMGLNTGLVTGAAGPFGGIKQSGLGREGGAEGIEEYLNLKYTRVGPA